MKSNIRNRYGACCLNRLYYKYFMYRNYALQYYFKYCLNFIFFEMVFLIQRCKSNCMSEYIQFYSIHTFEK